jgi:hypothetical protein
MSTSILLMFLLAATTASFSQSSTRFPGKKSELTSPDGRWVLQDVDRDQEPNHSIFLKDRTNGKTRKICDYERGVGLVWSTDSRHFALNNYAGSDFTETSILSVDERTPAIDVQDGILRHDIRLRERVTLVGWDHDYFGVARWLDKEHVVVHHWGHATDLNSTSRIFCECYIYALNGEAQKCDRQPKHPEGDFCETSTP